MSKLDDEMVATIATNLSFLQLAITDANTHSREDIANFLWQWMRSNQDAIERNWRIEATANRANLNNGYTKAMH
jgi:hypothetical protein|tara:strand:- start:192 stop:413 length:222 start_codon:yes stop_codon:yes gene_type:complete